ncbi:hypothetical protein RGQ15_13990 [Paracoccus sp. MBLB3053]|uniref:Uncharacterized protein n=1 Tax=Paracoccus aurantius TaxID=3073814 RepID=A0ABU2HUF0_9RHOB|nr:hypothetical protein [Paracoccus sp. MBLB3053]MDS9468673.1 hypothetical protein [Paracoccus sp. MBLB3053]
MKSRNRNLILVTVMALAATSMAVAQHGLEPDAVHVSMRETASGVPYKIMIGAPVGTDRLHHITRPGLYGISAPPAGSTYGVIDGYLIRYDPQTMQVQSIIRQIDEILD